MSIENLFPIAGNNAIQNAAFAIEWQAELSSGDLQRINAVIESDLKSEFPVAVPQSVQKFSFVTDIASAAKFSPSIELGGYFYEKRSQFSNIPTRSITLSKQSLIVQINEYSRWALVWKDVFQYLSIILKNIDTAINNVGLQYSDVFVWKDDPKSLNLAEVFKPNSKYLIPNVLSLGGLWHSHHGYIVKSDAPIPNSRLDNINVNLIDNAGTLSVQIITSHRATLNDAIWLKTEHDLNKIDQIMNVLHAENKLVMLELLSTDVCNKIKLEVNQ